MFEITYHEIGKGINAQQIKHERDIVKACEFIRRKLINKRIDHYDLWQIDNKDNSIRHDVTEVYQRIIESGL